jgi:hypothetical protein
MVESSLAHAQFFGHIVKGGGAVTLPLKKIGSGIDDFLFSHASV